MRHTEAAEATQAKSDVTLMPFSFQRSVNNFYRLKTIVIAGSIYSAIFNLNETCTDDATVA